MFTALRQLPVAAAVFRPETLPIHARDYTRDTVMLGWDDRLRARGRRTSDGGIEFGTALPRGTILRAGDCLVLDGPRSVVVVVERNEAVFVIAPRTPEQWGLFAYHIGNNHQPMMIAADGIVCPDVPGMEELLAQHAIPFARASRPFTPVGHVPDHAHA